MSDALTLEALIGAPPLPWQVRLFKRFRNGEVPQALDLPTGLGKTSTMACWLAAHAAAGGLCPGLPRRLVYVVDRRAVVDQATSVAQKLGTAWNAAAPSGDLHLRIATLRGQHVDSGEWVRHPADLAIVVGTVDMIGSRLLFSGYGIAPKMRPVHAGLLACDTLLVLDEAHLSPAFAAIGDSVASDAGLRGTRGVPIAPFRFLSLSATQKMGMGWRDVLSLADDDLSNDIVNLRLHAKKLVEWRTGATADAIAAAAQDVAEAGSRVIVFTHSRDLAEKVAGQLGKTVGSDKVTLFTGGRRVNEREMAAKKLEADGFIAEGDRDDVTRFLVATSAAEVGVDIDADHAVMDLVPWERMVQRLGRVNRRGRVTARVLICDAGSEDIATCRKLLSQVPNASPAALRALAESDPNGVAAATTPDPLRPPLVRPEIDAWSLTNIQAHPGRADVAPFLRGWVEDEPQIRLVWRRHLPLRPGQSESDDARSEFFEAAPVQHSELLEVEIGVFRDWLKKRLRSRFRNAEGVELDPGLPIALVLDDDGTVRRLGSVSDLRERLAGAKPRVDRFFESLIGRRIVFDARFGGLSPSGTLDAGSDDMPPTIDGDADWGSEPSFLVTVETMEALEKKPAEPVLFAFPFGSEEDGRALVVRGPVNGAADGRGELRSRGVTVPLDDHGAHVQRAAARIAGRLGLCETDRAILDHAARLHDAGKAARHWQAAMGGLSHPGGPWAKTPRGDGRALGGYRHEFGSLLAAQEDPEVLALAPEDRDLVLHLIAAHHGNTRPFIAAHGGDRGPPSEMERHAAAAALRFAALNRRWGPWGLSWWEALLRTADWQASEAEQSAKGRSDG